MCQLTLVNLRDKKLNQIFLAPQLQINSIGNTDGTGFFALNKGEGGVLYKTAVSADCLDELGWDLKVNINSDRPIIAHVRAASTGIVVKDENAHPFEGKRFVLAHNGRLYPIGATVSYNSRNDDTGLESDSLTFLNSLEAKALEKPTVPFLELITDTMKGYMGKFALLIYDKKNDKHYVVRGSSADLHIIHVGTCPIEGGTIEYFGYVVNTKKTSLKESSTIAVQMGAMIGNKRLFLSEVTELDKESVYEVCGKDLVKIGEIKETAITYTSTVATPTTTHGDYNRFGRGSYTSPAEVNTNIPIWKHSERILKFMEEHFLGIVDIDALFVLFIGRGLADAQLADVEYFVDKVIEKISAPKEIRKKITKILDEKGCIYPNTYLKVEGLEYPWMLNNKSTLEKMMNYLKQWKRGKG
jgi:predicted glutamine amidotransferase